MIPIRGRRVKRFIPRAFVLYSAPMDERFMEVYRRLRGAYGPRRWWPVTPPGGTAPRYTGGPRSGLQRFEVAVGAVLTQNTAWSNAARAIESLNRLGAMSPRAIERMDIGSLAAAIRSAGYYNQKAKRLKTIARYFRSHRTGTREGLLALDGVGPETADSIMLYAFGARYFVVDAYTRRLFGRLALVDPSGSYEEIRDRFERNLPRRVFVYREYHALIVEHGKQVCRKSPMCKNCLLKNMCLVYLEEKESAHRGNG
jgi:endonuclease III related protein